jgi:hypothetical protein
MSLMHFEQRARELRHRYRTDNGMMSAKDVAREERCTERTARRLIENGELGDVYARNSRVKRISVEAYLRYLERQTIIMKSSA